jgi:GNAT superfamily N-acetyltransferase
MKVELCKGKKFKMGDMEGRMQLRPAHSDDLETIALMMDYLGYPAVPSELKTILSDILSNPAMKLFLVVYTDGKPIGLINLHYLPALRLKAYQVSIEELVVHPDFRGQAVGKKLLDFAREYAEKKGAVRLEVIISNKRESYKRRFYTKNGFEDAASSVYRINFKPENYHAIA